MSLDLQDAPRAIGNLPRPLIHNRDGSVQYEAIAFLGKGSFSEVYEVKKINGTHLACKVIHKRFWIIDCNRLLSKEIKIHRSLDHPNVVRFYDDFWEGRYVYHTLDLCPNNSLEEVLPKRCRFTEPEARFFMVQLVGACHYMHTHQVIHHDLKPSNLLLDANMNIKVADFGLADIIVDPKKPYTNFCGTYDYMAPEIFDEINGHGFGADIWSIGVILYVLVVGFPPFPGPDVENVRRQILRGHYDFPTENGPSLDVKALIRKILILNPRRRLKLLEIVEHPFFSQAIVPPYIPTSALNAPPDFGHITKAESQTNLRHLKHKALLPVDDVQMKSIAVPWRLSILSGEFTGTMVPDVVRQFQISKTVGCQSIVALEAIKPQNSTKLLHTKVKSALTFKYSGAAGVMTSFVAALNDTDAFCQNNILHATFLFNHTHHTGTVINFVSLNVWGSKVKLRPVNVSMEQWTHVRRPLLLRQMIEWLVSDASKGPVVFVFAWREGSPSERGLTTRKSGMLVIFTVYHTGNRSSSRSTYVMAV